VATFLRSGHSRPLLEEWELPSSDIYLLFPTRQHMPARTRALIDIMLEDFAPYRRSGRDTRKIEATPW
jgi:LysR family transcriptional activator of dmlA